MRYAQMLLPTTKEMPSEADVISHQLLVRGGFIRKLTSGMYTFLPLGFLALQRVTAIVREEVLKANPAIADTLKPIFESLDLVTLQTLNARVQIGGEPAKAVAEDYLTSKGLLK